MLLSNPDNIYLSVGIAILITVLPYVLYTYGLSKTSAGKAAVLALVEPLTATIVGTVIFGEKTGILGVLGIIIVAVGLLYLSREKV